MSEVNFSTQFPLIVGVLFLLKVQAARATVHMMATLLSTQGIVWEEGKMSVLLFNGKVQF